jgi:Gram-negative bacterial TonB protein C-terminal
MRKVILLLFLIISAPNFAQIGGEDEVYLKGERIDPTFNGGDLTKFYEYINSQFDFSKPTKEGTMVSSFTITETGEIKNIKVVQFVDVESATEMIRVLKSAPKWKPATRNSKAISVDMKFPFKVVKKAKTVENNLKQKPQVDDLTVVPSTSVNLEGQDEIYNSAGVEKKPEHKGGIQAFYKYIANNYNLPSSNKFKGGRILVSFVVEKDGSLTDILVLKDAGFGTGEEAVRVLKACDKWTPAIQKGVPVRCSYTLPITLSSSK